MNSASVRLGRPCSETPVRSVNWHSTAYGLFKATSIGVDLRRDASALACHGQRSDDSRRRFGIGRKANGRTRRPFESVLPARSAYFESVLASLPAFWIWSAAAGLTKR